MEVVRADPKKTFKLEKRIGKGTYGEVWQACYRSNGQNLAIKIIDDIAEALEEVKETRALNRLCYNHPNLPQFMGVYVNSPADDLLQPQVWIAMELCGGGTVTELSKRWAKLVPCLSTICPDDLIHRHLSNNNTSITNTPPTNFQHKADLLNKLAVAHCPCLSHRRARNKRRLEVGIKMRPDLVKKHAPLLYLPRNFCNIDGRSSPGRLPAVVMQYLLYSTVSALAHLHSFGVIHRDVKGSNILLTDSGEVKLVDFGISCRLKDTLTGRTTIIGTPYWMAPEVIDTEKSEGYDTRADVWSLGVTGLELWEAEPPLAGVPPMKAFSLITHGPHPLSLYPSRLPPESEEAKDDLLQPCSDLMPPEMFDLLSKCLDKDKTRRPSSAELLKHRFLSGVPLSLSKARNHLLALMRSVNGVYSGVRRFSEPPRCSYVPPKHSIEVIGERGPERLEETGPAAVSTDMSLDSSSGSAATAAPKGLTQRYTSTISLNISSSSPTPSTVNTNTNAPTIRSPKIGSDGSSRRRGDSQHPPQNISLVPNSRHSPLLQSTIRTATASSPITPPPIHRSQSAKYCSSIPTASSAYFTGNSNTGNSTIEESDGAVISASRVMGKVEEEEEDDMFVEQRSDIDMESSGEYEREDVIALVERERNGEAKQTLEDVHKEVMHRMPEQEGFVTDVNGVLVYISPTSEYRGLFQPHKDDLKSFVRQLLHQAHDEHYDQIIFVVGKPQEPTFRLCQIICEEAPFLLTTTKELIHNILLIAEKLIGRQELSLRGVEFVFSTDYRLVNVSARTFLNAYTSISSLFENPLLRAFSSYVNPRSKSLSSSSKDFSEIVQFHLLIMSAGFSPQEIISLYRLLISIAAIRALKHSRSGRSSNYGRLQTLPEDIYTSIQKMILRRESFTPFPLSSVTTNDVARLIGVGEKDFNNLVFSKSTWKEPTGRGLVSRHFWRYLHLRRRRLLCSSITTYSQNDSGFFEDFTNNRKRNRRIWRQDLPTHGPKNYFKRRRRKANPLGIYHFQYLKHAVPPKHHGGPKPNRDVVEVLCRRLHELCVSVVFNRLNSLLRASLNKEMSGRETRIKVYNFIPSSKSLVSNALLDLLHAKFVAAKKRMTYLEQKDPLKLDDFYEHQSKRLLERLLQAPNLGYLSTLTFQEFVNQTFPSTECDFSKFCVMHYHGKEEYPLQSVYHKLTPRQNRGMLELLQSSNIPFLREFRLEREIKSVENLVDIVIQVTDSNTSVSLISVLDDGRSRVVDCQPQTITLPHLSPPLSEQLTSRRHLRVLQECGLLNFAAINNTASGLTVFKADEFLRTFAVLDYLPSNEERSLKALANKLVKAGKRPCGTYLWHGTATKPLNLAFFNDKIVKIVDNCGVLSDLYFVSRDWVFLSTIAVKQLKLELLKHSIASRRIQRWWRRRHEQRLILMNISNFLLHPATTATNATTVSTVNNNFNFPEAVDRRSVLPAEAGETPAYVVTNAFVSNIMMPQIYEIPQVPPHLQHQQKKSKRPPPSAGIAWFEPRHQRPPAYPPVARNERPVTLVESPGTRVLSRQHSAYGPPDMPAVNLRRSNSARSVDNHHITFVSSPIYSNEGRPLTRSSSTNVGNIGREAQGGVQRRIRHKTNDMPELGARRPVSWHVDQMEAQVSAHLEKQRLLNGGHSPVSGRRGSSAVRMAEDQFFKRHGPRHANFENGQPRTSFNGGGGGGVFYPSLHSRSPLSAEAQREEYIRVQAEITRGEFRGSREPNSSPPGRLACAGRVEVVDSRQKDNFRSPQSSKSFNVPIAHGSHPDIRILPSDDSVNLHHQSYAMNSNNANNSSNRRDTEGAMVRSHGLQPGIPPHPSSVHRRRPQTTLFDGPLTPNLLFISPSANSVQSVESSRNPRVAFVTSSAGGKVVIPVGGTKSSAPSLPTSRASSARGGAVDNRGLKAPGCPRSYCYD
uniref:non-specific serine/threonine protein kinase n=1 Tax=Echinococcus granulosus TaxID=6210 RepID=A0A068WXM8_ECHGR|nr:myosin iiia [Echinococcus granulosus]